MDSRILSDIAVAIAKGDVALWLGPDWDRTGEEDVLKEIDWLGVWVESPRIPGVEQGRHSQTPSGRLVIDVPGSIEEVLGEHFSLADVCPYFLLHDDSADTSLSVRQRRIVRDQKVEQLERLRDALLVVAGYEDYSPLREHLVEICDAAAADCRHIVLAGIGERDLKTLLADLKIVGPERVVPCEWPLPTLLREVAERRGRLPAAPSVRVGTVSIPLDRLLRHEPPIDQDFIIITQQDTRDPEPDEIVPELLARLIGGIVAPWRAFAHHLEWQRPSPQREQALMHLRRLRRGIPHVLCLNIPAEPGAGLTTILNQIAFDAARDGSPALVHRSHGEIDYDRLRSFLTDLDAGSDARGVAREPAVVVFDSDSVLNDVVGQLKTIGARMARDGRRVLIIRGIALPNADDYDQQFRQVHACRRHEQQVEEEWLPLLSATLDENQQGSLLGWAKESLPDDGGVPLMRIYDLVHDWERQAPGVPLLIFLYAILSGELRDAARLGLHLTKHLRNYIQHNGLPTTEAASNSAEPLTGNALLAAVASLQASMGSRIENRSPSAEDVAAVFIALCAMGCLRLSVTRTVLADVAGVDRSLLLEVINLLEQWNLARTDLPLNSHCVRSRPTLAPSAFYTKEESVGLLHPAYGRLVLEWLMAPTADEDREMVRNCRLAREFLEAVSTNNLRDEIPLPLLKPVLRSLRPLASHVRFAEDIAMRLLRVQKGKRNEALSKWQWSNVEAILEAFGYLDEQLVQQSASLLHSRGITTYKSCRPSLSVIEARTRYTVAERDFHRGIELARSGGSERPVTIMTSLGLLYLGWLEREREERNVDACRELDSKVEETLRSAIAETDIENPYASFGLASYLISRCKRSIPEGAEGDVARVASDLAEAIEWLQFAPEPTFEEEWNDLRLAALGLLGRQEMRRTGDTLKARGDELGFVIAALNVLEGRIPDVPTAEPTEVAQIRKAAAILHDAAQCDLNKRCTIASLLRYALFSADPDRLIEPAYQTRFELISELVGSRQLEVALWQYDYAMLCFQTGRFSDGADAFAQLRRGRRFFQVPRERSCFLTDADSRQPATVFMRVISIQESDGKGWGRIEHPVRFRDPVPFSLRGFRSRGRHLQVGHSLPCHINLNPAGPFAEHIPTKEL